MKRQAGALYLIPWTMGDSGDLTLNAARCVRRLRVFLAEHPDVSRKQFEPLLGAAAASKEFLALPEEPDARFLGRVRELLDSEDVGVISDGGVPCFVDPGAWLVAALRRERAAIKALPGGSALGTMLSLSGVEFRRHAEHVFTFAYFLEDPRSQDRFVEAAARASEPLFVLLHVDAFRRCLETLAGVVGARPVTVFFDLSKTPRSKFPYADRVISMTCSEWLEKRPPVRWERVSDVCLMVEPEKAA